MNCDTIFHGESSLASASLPSSQVRRRSEERISQEGVICTGEALGMLRILPIEMILFCFTYLEALQLLTLQRLNKTFHLLSADHSLWQKLTLTLAPNLAPEVVNDWKAQYREEERTERNFVLMRKRTFSLVARAAPPKNKPLLRGKALTAVPGDYYYSLDAEGNLRAINQRRFTEKVYDVDGQPRTMNDRDWNVKGEVQNQFVLLAILDGRCLFTPKIELEPLLSLNPAQAKALIALNLKIKNWLAATAIASDLDEQVANSLKNHYNHIAGIDCRHGAAQHLTPDYKAYLLFFRTLIENPVGLKKNKLSYPP